MASQPVVYELEPDSHEPLVTVGSVTAAGAAVLALVAAFGLHVSDGQQAAILGVLSVVAPIVVALWGRRKVYSPATVARLLAPRGARSARLGEHGPEDVILPSQPGATITNPYAKGRATPPDAGTIL